MGIYETDISQFPTEAQIAESIPFNTMDQQIQNERDLRARVKVTPLEGFHFKSEGPGERIDFSNSVVLSLHSMIEELKNGCEKNNIDQNKKLIEKIGIATLAKTISDERETPIIELFRNKHFLTLLRLIISSTKISYDTKVYLNSLILQELLSASSEYLPLYKGLAQEVNADSIALLNRINRNSKTLNKIDNDTMIYMTIGRYSSFDVTDNTNIFRLNGSIINSSCDHKTFTVEVLTELYCVFFDSLSNLFAMTWLDPTGTNDPNKANLIQNQCFALLNILEAQAYNVIYTVLRHTKDCYMQNVAYGYNYIKMPFECIPSNYVHIWSVLQHV